MIAKNCYPGHRCRDWRACGACARIRQARIADIVERGAAESRRITYAVVMTASPNTIKADKARLVDRVRQQVDGGIWIIEKGEIKGLHLNLIAGGDVALTASSIAKAWGSAGEVWAEEIEHSQVRMVAAYCAKKEGFPLREEFAGHIYGSFGTWKSPLQALSSEEARYRYPLAHAAALEVSLERAGVPAPDPIPTHTDRENHLRRVYAAARGELSLHGFCYIPGHGIATLEEARRLGLRGDENP